MATSDFVGGLAADPFNDIDDPFSGSLRFAQVDLTIQTPAVFPEAVLPEAVFPEEGAHTGRAEDTQAGPGVCEDEWTPVPVSSRPSGLITLPVSLFAPQGEAAPARPRAGWSERLLVLGMSTIILAASVTALRKHGSHSNPALSQSLLTPRQEHIPHAVSPQQLPALVFTMRAPEPSRVAERGRFAHKHQAHLPAALRPAGERDTQLKAARSAARDHYAARDYAQAVTAYERAARLDPSDAFILAGLGAARLQVGNVRGAIRAYERAVRLTPSRAALHASLGHAWARYGNAARARASYKRAFALDPDNQAVKLALTSL